MKYTLLPALLIGAFAFSGPARAEDERCFSPENFYSVQFPKGWTATKEGGGVLAVSPENDQLITIESQMLPAVSVFKFIELNMELFGKSLMEFKKLEGGLVDIPNANSKSHWAIISYKNEEGQPVKMLYYYIFSVKDRRFHTLACSATYEKFDTFRASFDDIARSFVITNRD